MIYYFLLEIRSGEMEKYYIKCISCGGIKHISHFYRKTDKEKHNNPEKRKKDLTPTRRYWKGNTFLDNFYKVNVSVLDRCQII